MSVRFRIALDVGMSLADRDREGRHEACSLIDTRRQLFGQQIGEGFSGDTRLGRVVFALCDPWQYSTGTIAGGSIANSSGPASVVPWNPNRTGAGPEGVGLP